MHCIKPNPFNQAQWWRLTVVSPPQKMKLPLWLLRRFPQTHRHHHAECVVVWQRWRLRC